MDEAFRRLLGESDLMQGFTDIVADGLEQLNATQRAELRAVAVGHAPADAEEAAARAMVLFMLDNTEWAG